MLRFLAGLLAIDAAIVIGVIGLAFVVPRTVPAPVIAPPTAPTAGHPAAAGPDAGPPPPLWKAVDTTELAHRVGDLYLGVRHRIGRGKKLVLNPPRRIGDDVEIRVSLARASTFPAGLYCFHCPAQRCLFPEPTATALEALAGAFDPEAVHALAVKIGKEHLQLAFVGGASAGPVVPKTDAQVCDGAEPRVSVRMPPAFDLYEVETCGQKSCELAGSGETLDIGAGAIDDNKKLACLRAMCTAAAAPALAGVPARIVGELAFEQGGAFRGAEVSLTLRGIAAPENREAYQSFWNGLTQVLGDDGK
jgi:hypothetical protein